jgi:hypothetical protein
MSVLLLPPIFQFFDNNGAPLANGFIDVFAAGTTTRQATYTSAAGTTQAPNPIQLNAAGRPTSGGGAIWGEGSYKFIVRDANGVQVGDTLDNVTSFAGLVTATNAYAELFSGNGTQTVFTTSSALGTDPKGLLVSVASGLQEIAQNGSFTTDTLWTKGAGWTIGSGVATATGAISTGISQIPVLTVVAGQAYAVTYTITRSAGGLIPSIGGQNGVERTASGTYREIIIAAASTPIAFTGNAFTGTLDNVSVTEAVSENMALLPTSAYTINGTTLTFATAPAAGVNNIDVRAPSLLVGAASTAANLAQVYAANALASQTAAAASAALASSNVKTKPAVACATTANITLSGEQTIDTVLTSASRVLVKNQLLAINNGVYVSDAGAWTRATDADTWTEIQGQSVFTLGGSANINKTWANTNEVGGTIGVTDITWTELNPGMMSKPIYDPDNISEQVVGLTHPQTLTNKTLTAPIINGAIGGSGTPKMNNFRLTPTSGVPVQTGDANAVTALYMTPYNGNQIALHNGTRWHLRTSAEISISLAATTAGLGYDVFCYDNAGVPILELTAWTNSTTRATALVYLDGILVKSGATTRRYLGSFYCHTNGQTASSLTHSGATTGRYIFNYYNRVRLRMQRYESTSSWAYNSGSARQANGSTANQLNFFVGVVEDNVFASQYGAANITPVNSIASTGVGLNSTTVYVAGSFGIMNSMVSGHLTYASTSVEAPPANGLNYLAWIENGNALGSTLFGSAYGCGIHGAIFC